MNEYKCETCKHGDLSVDRFPCDACHGGSHYEPEEGTVSAMSDCNKCIWSTRDGGCVSWKCDFVSHEDARKMIEKERKDGESHDD